MRFVVGVALLLLTSTGTVEADTVRSQLGADRLKAIETLTYTDQFADAYVSIVGSPSREACAFRTILEQPDADRLFKSLLGRARLPGRLYALCGLYFTDHDRFLREIQPYRESPDSVKMFSGCLMGWQSVSQLVESSHPRAMRLRDRKETTLEWMERNKEPNGSMDYVLDILGGGWSARFKEMRACE